MEEGQPFCQVFFSAFTSLFVLVTIVTEKEGKGEIHNVGVVPFRLLVTFSTGGLLSKAGFTYMQTGCGFFPCIQFAWQASVSRFTQVQDGHGPYCRRVLCAFGSVLGASSGKNSDLNLCTQTHWTPCCNLRWHICKHGLREELHSLWEMSPNFVLLQGQEIKREISPMTHRH